MNNASVVANIPSYGFQREEKDPINSSSFNVERCFPLGKYYDCYEYDENTRTKNYGPPTKLRRNLKRDFQNSKSNLTRQLDQNERFIYQVLNKTETFTIYPEIRQHVGLDPSLFGWLLPSNPMTFSVFREPTDRLISAFHYGIYYGADRPGRVAYCIMPKRFSEKNPWNDEVTRLKENATLTNDTSAYQSLFREYLLACRHPNFNAYVQFLDPNTKNTTIALRNLEKHVIVGMQTAMNETIHRWINIILNSCHDHPQYETLQKLLCHVTHRDEVHVTHRDEVTTNTDRTGSIGILKPDIGIFDEDLQDMIREYTSGDYVIYKRAQELYNFQRHWSASSAICQE